MHFFLNKFRRVTSQGNFIAQIDGLRFLAIFLVVVFHMNGFFAAKGNSIFIHHYENQFNHVLLTWDKGVELFFAISGFILALPFASHTLAASKKVSLKFFYLRRVTRLEPPYMLTMALLFMALLITKRYGLSTLLPSLLASLTYTHNILFGVPLIAIVTWSLEIEIQFYIIAPLISKVYAIGKLKRRLLLVALILLFPIIQYVYPVKVLTLYSFIQYFLIGFLLADLYVVKDIRLLTKNSIRAVATGILLFMLILIINNHHKPYGDLLFGVAVFLFYYLVLFNDFWKKVFSIPVLSTIGGMCYSIYLWHFAIISVFGKYLIKFRVSGNYILDLSIFCLLMFIPVLVLSGIFFLYVEKPCMAKNWYKNLLLKLGYNRLGAFNKA